MGDQVLIRMDPALKDQLAKVAKIEGKTSSEVIRALVEDYLKQRDIGAYIDSLWEKFGKDLKSKKFTSEVGEGETGLLLQERYPGNQRPSHAGHDARQVVRRHVEPGLTPVGCLSLHHRL